MSLFHYFYLFIFAPCQHTPERRAAFKAIYVRDNAALVFSKAFYIEHFFKAAPIIIRIIMLQKKKKTLRCEI